MDEALLQLASGAQTPQLTVNGTWDPRSLGVSSLPFHDCMPPLADPQPESWNMVLQPYGVGPNVLNTARLKNVQRDMHSRDGQRLLAADRLVSQVASSRTGREK